MSTITPLVTHPDYLSLRHENQALLPEGQTLVLVPFLDIALLIDWPARQLVAGCTFGDEDYLLLLPMLRAWPDLVPYPCLLARLSGGRTPSLEQEAAMSQRYQKARAAGTQERLLVPLYARLAELHHKLSLFGLQLVPVSQEGVVLAPAPKLSASPEGGAAHG